MEFCETQQPETNRLPKSASSHMNIKKVIGILSSKGGVGKSSLTGLLAVELCRAGLQVGILDAEMTCPSITMIFGVQGPVKTGSYSFLPLQTRSGIKVISPNLLVEDGTQPFIWKSALAGKVIQELYKEVEWGDLDYLLIDLPPAVSEVTVEVLQTIPFDGVVIVSQPQELSAKITARAVRLAQKMDVDIIGVVENQSYYLAPNSTEKQCLFGPSHIDSLCSTENLPILARLPYNPDFSNLCDQGKIEDVLVQEGKELLEAINTSLTTIESEKLEHPKPIVSSPQEDPQNEINVDTLEEASQQVTQAEQYFSDTVVRLVQNKDNLGAFDHPDAEGYFTGSCGDRMQIHLQIINERILSARFLADGCGATLACGSMITKMACSKTLNEAEKISSGELISALDGLPDDHLHCAELAVMTLREAIIDAVEGHAGKKP